MENQVTIIGNDNVAVSYNQDRANIDSQVATAKAYPRDMQKSVNNSIFIATMDKETASSCTYSVPRGGKPITGPSVNLARILVQCWGNLRAETKVIDITDKHVVSQATCWDIENNVAVKVEVRRSIMTKNGRMSDDMITVTGNAGNAIAYRNAVYAVLPKSVIDKVYKSAMGLLTGDISDETKLIKQRNKVVEGLKKAYGVTDEEILFCVGKSKLEYIGADEIVVLIGVGTAIKDGDTTIEEAFRPTKKGVATPKIQEKEKLSDADLLDVIAEIVADNITLDGIMSQYELTDEQIKTIQDATV
jgi:hypothetical protein